MKPVVINSITGKQIAGDGCRCCRWDIDLIDFYFIHSLVFVCICGFPKCGFPMWFFHIWSLYVSVLSAHFFSLYILCSGRNHCG